MHIKEKLQHIIKESLKSLINIDIEEIEINNLQDNYTYTTNIAIKLVKDLHKKPEEIANIIKKNIKLDLIEKIEFNYPGLIKITINKYYMFNEISEIINKNINYGKNKICENKKINLCIRISNIESLLNEDFYSIVYIDNLSRLLKNSNSIVTEELYIIDTLNQIENLSNNTKEKYKNICSKLTETKTDNSISYEIATYIYKLYNNKKLEENINYFKKESISIIIDKLKQKLDKYRINFTNYICIDNISNSEIIDTVLNKLNKSGYTYFDKYALYLKTTSFKDTEDKILVNSDGSYTDLLILLAYYIELFNKDYDGIIDINYNNKYKNIIRPILSLLNYDINKLEIKNITIPSNIYSSKEIDINNTRYIMSKDPSLLNDSWINIQETLEKLYKTLKEYPNKIIKVEEYNNIDSPLAYTILNKLYDYKEVVKLSTLKQTPYKITNYIYELSQLIEELLNTITISKENNSYIQERLNLLLAINIVINNSLDLIGIIPKI